MIAGAEKIHPLIFGAVVFCTGMALPLSAASGADTTTKTAPHDATARTRHPVIFNGQAPPGAQVRIDSTSTRADSAGRWQIRLLLDSATRTGGVLSLCLEQGAQKACVPLHPSGYDTLELAPLHFIDTARTVVDTTPAPPPAVDSAARVAAQRNAVNLDNGNNSRTVVVHGHRRPLALGEEHVTTQQVKRLPGLAEPDVIRAVQALPGVVSSSDFSTKLYVRGSPSDENLVLFDNAVVYSPSHFGGLFSTFLADGIGGLDFYEGGFDPYWGNRLASVLVVHSKDGGSTYDSTSRLSGTALGDSTHAEGSARVTTFSGSAETDGRRGDWSWVLAGRRTWIDQALNLADGLNLTDFHLDYFFYDWQGNLAWGNQYDTVRVSWYQGRDNLNISPLAADWGNLDVPVNVHWRLSPYWSYDGVLAYSGFDQNFAVASVLNLGNSIGTLNTRQDLHYAGFPGHTLAAGYEFNRFWIDFSYNFPLLASYQEDVYALNLQQAYLQDKWVVNPRHTVTFGVRGYNYPAIQPGGKDLAFHLQHLEDYFQFDPRLTYTYRPAKNWRYDAHLGYYHQYLTSLSFTDQETINEFWYAVKSPMPPTTSLLASTGVERSDWTRWGLTASLDGYYKDIRSIPLFDPSLTGSVDSSTHRSDISKLFGYLNGYALGAEFSLKRDQGAVSGEASYAYAVAVLKPLATGTDSLQTFFRPYYADWDQRQTFKLNLAVNWRGGKNDALWPSASRGKYFRSSLQWNIHTGLPYTGLDYTRSHDAFEPEGLPEQTPALQTFTDDPNDFNVPYYARLDITPIDIGRVHKWRFYWTIINVFGRKNPFLVNIDRNANPPTKTYFYQFPFLPIFLGYEYEF